MTATRPPRLAQFVLDRAAVMVFCVGRDGRFLYVNDEACRALGYGRAELLARRAWDIDTDPALTAESVPGRWERVRDGARVRETTLRTRDGRLLPVELTSNLVELAGAGCVVTVARDLAERRQVEEQLRRAQKMDAVSRLAGGIAHDFDNLLTAILGYTDLLLSEMGPDDPRQVEVEGVRKAAERACDLTQQLLAFAGRQAVRPEPLQVNDVIAGIEPLLKRMAGDRVQVTVSLGAGLGPVMADRGQLEQVIVNLVVNGLDAMPSGGRIEIESEAVIIGAGQAPLAGGPSAGSYARISVADTGVGMSEEARAHLFEPFFTTKSPGAGAGLGLAVAYGVVEQAGGRIVVEGRREGGTLVRVCLPTIESPESLARMGAATASGGPAAPAVGGRRPALILVVEDEPAVLELVRDVLVREGYRVLTAALPSEALARAAEVEGPLDLLLTDMVMPEMNGRLLAARVTSARPETRVLFMSGYTDQVLVLDAADADTAFLQKPFSPHALVRKVRELLER